MLLDLNCDAARGTVLGLLFGSARLLLLDVHVAILQIRVGYYDDVLISDTLLLLQRDKFGGSSSAIGALSCPLHVICGLLVHRLLGLEILELLQFQIPHEGLVIKLLERRCL